MCGLKKTYLEEGEQLLTVNDRDLSGVTLNLGVPQGLILGSMLFLAYILMVWPIMSI